jgi:adenosylhomocysteinase
MPERTSQIDDPQLAAQGEAAFRWFAERMPVQRALGERFGRTRPLTGRRVAVCLHVEPKLVAWIDVLIAGGVEALAVVGCIGSTQAATAAYLATRPNVTVYAREADDWRTHNDYITEVLSSPWEILVDNGSSLTTRWHESPPAWVPLGATEETRTGKLRLAATGLPVRFPVIVVDDSPLKRTVENSLGVGQSVVDGILRATSLILGGKRVLVMGYGWCGQGISRRLLGMGAIPMVCEVDPIRRLQAKLEGNLVGSPDELLPLADLVITVTGRDHALTLDHVPLLKKDAILCNAGHFSTEIDVEAFGAASTKTWEIRKGITAYEIGNRKFFLLCQGHLVNLAAADGNPIEVMDLGLALQALSMVEISLAGGRLPQGVQPVPEAVNRATAELCLAHF